jgi:hypothetical protein
MTRQEQLLALIRANGNCFRVSVECKKGMCPFYTTKGEYEYKFTDILESPKNTGNHKVTRFGLIYEKSIEMYAKKYNKEDIVEILL